MALDYNGSSSHRWATDTSSVINELFALSEGLDRASKAEFQATVLRMRSLVREVQETGRYWATSDLMTDYRSAYLEYGEGAIPKSFVNKAYRQRKKATVAVDRLTANLNSWVENTARDSVAALQANALRAREQQVTLAIGSARRDRLTPAAVQKLKNEQVDLRRKIKDLPDYSTVRGLPSVSYIGHKGPNRGKAYRSIDADSYAAMVAEAHHRLAQNIGNLAGMASKSKTAMVWVTDGPDCGWSSHRDPHKANGRHVSIAEALARPLAHPHCQRSFWPDKPRGPGPAARKAAQNVKDKATRENIAKVINQIAKDEVLKRPRSTREFLQLAGTVAAGVYKVRAVARSPLARRLIVGILDDADGQLPPIADKFLRHLVGYEASDALAIRAYGAKIGVTDRMAFRQRVMADTDTAMARYPGAEALEKIEIPEHVRVAMRLPKNPTREQVFHAYKDYFDYDDMLRADQRTWWQNLEEKVLRMRAVDGTVGMQGEAAAIQLHLSNPVGERVNTSWRILMRATASSAARNKEYLRRELTKTIGELVPSPFPGKSLGDLRFTIGFSQKGRVDLATKVYDQIRGGVRWTDDDIDWAEQLGLRLPVGKSLSRQDVINALLPRITWEPGKLFNATVSLENGRIIPLFRAYPPGTMRKWLAMDMRLRSGSVERVLREIRTAYGEGTLDRDFVKKILAGFVDESGEVSPGLIDDVITNFWFWKDGPLEGNLRFYGAKVAQYGATLQPDSGLIRISHRYKSGTPTLKAFDKEVEQEVFFVDEDGYIVKWGSHMSEMNVLPNYGGGLQIQLRDQNFTTAMIHFHMWHGNLMGVSKDTRYGYDQLLDWWIGIKEKVGDYRSIVTRAEIASIRTWEDFTRFVQELNFRVRSVHQTEKAAAKVGRLADIIDEADLEAAHPAFVHDIQEWYSVMRATHPRMNIPTFRIVKGRTEHELMFKNGEILVRDDVAKNWTEFQALRSKGVDAGLFPAGTYDRVANFYHEVAHSFLDQMTVAQTRRLWGRVGHSLDAVDDHWPGAAEGVNNFPFDDLENSFKGNSKNGINAIMAQWMSKGSRLSLSHVDTKNRPAGVHYWSVGAVRKKILRQVSGYAARNPEEFIAEAWSEYMTSPNPRPVAMAVGRYIKSVFGSDADLRLIK